MIVTERGYLEAEEGRHHRWDDDAECLGEGVVGAGSWLASGRSPWPGPPRTGPCRRPGGHHDDLGRVGSSEEDDGDLGAEDLVDGRAHRRDKGGVADAMSTRRLMAHATITSI